jgi:hypothetical protein
MSKLKTFSAAIEKVGSRSFIALPFDADEAWGARDRHSLTGSVGGCKWRGALATIGDRGGIALGPVWLRDAGLNVGDVAEVALSPEGPQAESLAEDIAAALRAEPKASAFFDSLQTFHRNNYMRWLDSAKKPETRAKRVREMVAMLLRGERK